jgi:hypothetical protein
MPYAFFTSTDFPLNLADCLFNKNLPSTYLEEGGQLEFVLVVLHSANLKIFSLWLTVPLTKTFLQLI